MARNLSDPNNQGGSTLNRALLDEEQNKQQQEQQQEQGMSGQPQLATRSRVSQAGQGTSPAVTAMPKPQQAGTGTFTNLRKYLEAARPASQERIAQTAQKRVMGAAGAAQKGIEQAKTAFGRNVEAGSLADRQQALEQAKGIISGATGVTYQPPQPVTPPDSESTTQQSYLNERDEYLKNTLGDKYDAFQKELSEALKSVGTADMIYNPISGGFGSSSRAGKERKVYEKYGIDVTKLPGYTPFDQYKASERIDRYGVGEPTSVAETPVVAPTEPAQPQQYISPEDQARFAEIINAAYQGPISLQQAGLYQSAAEKAREAQKVVGDVQTTTGRERILRDIFGRGRDYTQGQSRLDQLLLNTSEQGVRGLQEAAQQAGNLEQAMQQAVRETAAQAAQRRSEIEGIRGQAREAFTTARTGQEEAVEKRIDDLITNPALDEEGNPIPKLDTKGNPVLDAEGKPVYMTEWERLPAYFQDIFRQRVKNKALPLTERELGILGLSSGQGLFNIGQEAIEGTIAERGRLVTKDEIARQLALQQLAGLDVSKQLQKDLKYSDIEKAGTQDLKSSLDIEKFKRTLEERGANTLKKTLSEVKIPKGTPEFYDQSIGSVLKKLGLDTNKASQEDIINFMTSKLDAFKNNFEKEKQKFDEWYKENIKGSPNAMLDYERMGRGIKINRQKSAMNKAERTYQGFLKVFNELKRRNLLNVASLAEDDKFSNRTEALKELLNRQG
jgi:hypothetical protein